MDEHRSLEEIKHAAPYIAVYSLLCACAQLVLYWTKFNVNPFQYIDIANILSQSGMLLFQSLAFVLIVSLSDALWPQKEISDDELASEVKSLRIRATITIAMTIPAFIAAQYHTIFYALVIGLIIVLIRPISYTSIVRKSFTPSSTRLAASAFLVSLPTFSVVTPLTDASNIIKKNGTLTLLCTSIDGIYYERILIGKIGDYFALMAEDGNTFMIKSDSLKNFTLSKKNLEQE